MRSALLLATAALLALASAQPIIIDVNVQPKTPENPAFGHPDTQEAYYLRQCCESPFYEAPDLYLVRGMSYVFQMKAVSVLHPFHISTSPMADYNTVFSQNVVIQPPPGPFAMVSGNGTLTFTPDASSPDTLYYHCLFHQYMGGVITVADPDRPNDSSSPVDATTEGPTSEPPTDTTIQEDTATATSEDPSSDPTELPTATLPTIEMESTTSDSLTLSPESTEPASSSEEPTDVTDTMSGDSTITTPAGNPNVTVTTTGPDGILFYYTVENFFTTNFPLAVVNGTVPECANVCNQEPLCQGFARISAIADDESGLCFLKASLNVSGRIDEVIFNGIFVTYISECACVRSCVCLCACECVCACERASLFYSPFFVTTTCLISSHH
jgi:hypothetical protein